MISHNTIDAHPQRVNDHLQISHPKRKASHEWPPWHFGDFAIQATETLHLMVGLLSSELPLLVLWSGYPARSFGPFDPLSLKRQVNALSAWPAPNDAHLVHPLLDKDAHDWRQLFR